MGRKNSESSKYREWERERRERLNVSFNDLGSLLPNHDPAVVTSKVDILQKSAAYIRDLKKENSDLLLGCANKIQTKKIKRLQRYVEVLLLRVQQLAKLLKDAGITLPPEPPSITPLGEKPLRWSNKISAEDAEKAIQSIEKSPKGASQRKSKTTKKTSKDCGKVQQGKKRVTPESPAKSVNPKSPGSSTAETTSSESQLKSSQQSSTDTIVTLPRPENVLQESRSLPVSKVFGDTRVLTSLPQHIVNPDQQSGIIVIHTTGTGTLGTVPQQPPQSTCFVIDSGNGGGVGNPQANAIVASHPPTFEQRPTFVLAPNGSLLPVLSAPQFVAQPRQLIVSTSSPTVIPPKQSLAPLTFTAPANNFPCRKKLREVVYAKILPGDTSQVNKVPIPSIPRNRLRAITNSKDCSDSSSKASVKKKCSSPDKETSKINKNSPQKGCEKKLGKSVPETISSGRLPLSNTALAQNVCSSASDNCQNDKGSDVSVNSAGGAKENSADKRKRELDEQNSGDCVQQKKKKCENVISEEKSESTSSSAKQALGDASESHDVNLSHNNAFNSLVSSCSVSSYSIDALCKMNQKISSENSSEISKEEVPASTEKNPSGETISKNSSKVLESCNIHMAESIIPSTSAVSEGAGKSSVLEITEVIPNGSANSVGNIDSVGQLNSHNLQADGSNSVSSDMPDSNCAVANLTSDVNDSSVSRNAKESSSVDVENKGKDPSQPSILQSFGTSNFAPSNEESRKEREGRESSCEVSGVDESSLPPGTFSSDLFASLQVPSGHSESISPTAAFLLAFPLVSTLTGKTPDLGSDNHQMQPLTSMDSGSRDSEHSSGGCGSSFLQLGNLEDNSPSSSHSILSSLSSSNTSSLQPSILQKSNATLQPLLPSSIDRSFGHETVETDATLGSRNVNPTKEVPEKGMAVKEVSFIPSPTSGSLKESHMLQENSSLSQTTVSSSKDESLPSKKQNSKENNNESRNQTTGNISSEVSDLSSMPNMYSVNSNKSSTCDNNLVSSPSRNDRSPPSSNMSKSNVQPCPSHQLEPVSVDESAKKIASDVVSLPANNQQYAHYQLPYLSCSSTGVSESVPASNSIMTADAPGNNDSGNVRHDMQVFNHTLPNSSNSHVEFPGLHQNSSSLAYSSASQRYKTGDKTHSNDRKQIQHNSYPSNNYSQYNTTNALSSQVTTSSCFTVSSFTSSFPSSVSNSLFSSSTSTTPSMSFSSANSSLSLAAPSSYSDSVTFSASCNSTYLGSSSSYIPPIYSNSLSQLSTSTASYASTAFPPPPVSMLSADTACKTTNTVSKSTITSFTAASSNQINSFGSAISNSAMSSMPPTSYINSATSSNYDNGQKNSSLPIFSSHQRGSEILKGPNSSMQQKVHDHRNSSGNNNQNSEGVKSHNIFSIDQLNTQSYGYNYNDYASHVGSYVPQKPEMEMIVKKPPFTSSEGGNGTSRMPSSFSVAHNSSNFSILSWTTLSPMSAAPSSAADPPVNNINGKVDGYAAGGLSVENNSSTEKVSDSHGPTFPQSALPDIREITPSYSQLPAGNVVGTELSGSTGYHSSQAIGKQHSSRGHGSKQRQQVTNWMTAPDPIHSSTDFSHNNETVSNDNTRPDIFGNSSLSYSSNTGFYGHHNHVDVGYASNSHTTANGSTCPENESGLQSSTVGNNRVSMKACPSSSGGHSSIGDNVHLLQTKQSDSQQNQLLPSTYDKMASSSANYVHHSQGELPALPTLLGDLALGSCNSVKSYLPVYEENNSASSKMCKQDAAKTPSTSASSITCNTVLPAKDGRDGRQVSLNHDYGVSSFLSVSQLVENSKESSQQSQQKENDRGEKSRNRDVSKSSPSSRRNMRPSNVKRDGMGMAKEQLENSQTSHSSTHNSQSFCNQGIPPTVVSSNPTHLHAPPIPFPPYKSVHWPVNEISKMPDNSRNAANYKSSSSYSAEALIRPSLSTLPMESRIAESEIPAYGMDIHKFPISNGRGDHLYPDFVEGNGLSCNMDNAPHQQNQLKQQLPEQRQGNDNFRRSHHSHSERFNYPSSIAPSSTFHSHHHPHLPPPNFGGHDEYSVETGNSASTLGLPSNCMDFPFPHPKESAPLTSSTSNICLPLSYNPPNPCIGMGQSQNQQCRTQVEKTSVRNSSGGNCDDLQGRPSLEQIGRTKGECSVDGRSKQGAKETALHINNNSRTIPPLLPMESSSSSYLGHHHYHPHNHHSSPHHPGVSSMGPAPFTPINEPENQAPKLFSHLPPPSSGVTPSLPHHNAGGNSAGMCGSTSGGNISSGTLANFNLSTIFPEINDKQNHQNQMASSSSFAASSKNEKLCSVSSSAPILHPPPPPLAASYHHHQPHQHNHQSFPPPVDLGNRLPPPPSSVLHSNVGFNNLMVQSTPQVNGIAINSTLQPPPPSFSAPSFGNVLPGL
ncbi:hypothetical protein J437_LFUL008420 [Ladona fulva]|uniref:BHLH domain-containing protein n=1 Tax=Ladona fulva TaxID=123851 RepID=A0A8K0NUI0_LADFU|nr:hypothetical protein J437_LFUL008420 [Ladona fulva]